MNAYEVLAVVGGITGPAASVAEIWSISRDRPHLRFDIGFTTSIAREPRMWLDLYNDGRQPLTVREAGLYGSRFPVEINSKERGPVQATAFYTFKLVTAPDSGHQKRFEGGVPDAVTCGYHVDFPLRAYAIDARGRWIWGKAAPLVRMMLGNGPRPASIDAAQWDKPHTALAAARVAPRWKVWVRPELRRGDDGRPSYDALVMATMAD